MHYIGPGDETEAINRTWQLVPLSTEYYLESFFLFKAYIFYGYKCFTCMVYVHHVYFSYLQRSEEGTGVTDSCEVSRECWEVNLVSLQEQ